MEHDNKPPNLLFVFSDQHRWCDLGCYGNDQVLTPNFDAFAQQAARFENCISNSPLCVPARGTLLTGLLPLKHGAIANDLPIYTDVTSVAHLLNECNYHTGYIGKWHLAGVPRNQCIPAGKGRLGFKEWKVCNCNHDYMKAYYDDEDNNRYPIEGYEPITQTDQAIDFMKRNHERSWALYVSWGPPHDPYLKVPRAYLDLYEQQDIQLRPNVSATIVNSSNSKLTTEEIKNNLKGYYAHITALDEQFGRLLDALNQTGQLDNTIVVYTSDHGDMLGSQGFTNKQLPYEEAIKVPLMVYWQGRTITASCHEMIGLVDLPVSILGLAGVPFYEGADGQDLHRLFIDRQAVGLDECYIFDLIPCHQAEARGGSEWRGIRTRRHTYARSASDDGFALYDHTNDPYQLRNLVHDPDYAESKEMLKAALDRHISRHDKLVAWEHLICDYGIKEAWNSSQAAFKLPLLK